MGSMVRKLMRSVRGNAGRMSQYKKAYVLVANGMKIDFGEKVEAK